MMKRALTILLAAASTLFAGFEYSTTSITGGLSVLTGGIGYPGAFVALETNTEIVRYFGIGLTIDYTWIAVKDQGGNAGLNFITIGAVPKGYLRIKENIRAFVEFDPGIALTVAYYPTMEETGEELTDFSFITRYCQTYGIGMNLKQFVFGMKLKQIFYYKYYSGLWFNFYLGYTGM